MRPGVPIGPQDEVRAYPAPLRALHWLSAGLLLGPYATIWAIGYASDTGADVLAMLHRSLGLTILALTLVRLGVRLSSHAPPLPAAIPAVQKLMAHASVVALYGLLLLQPTVGLVGTMLSGNRATVFGSILLPALLPVNRGLADKVSSAHGWIAAAVLALAGLHVLAALHHHVVLRDDVLAGMLPALRRGRQTVSAPARSSR